MRPLLLALLIGGCSGTTGSGLVTFTARAGGPLDATGALEFDTGRRPSFHVVLDEATFHLGAIYLNMSVPSSGGPEEPCVLPGIYVGEAYGGCGQQQCGVDLPNLLQPDLVTFPSSGNGTANPAVEAEVWLTGARGAFPATGDINAADDTTPIFTAHGTASQNGQQWVFSATVTIGANRAVPVQNPAMPGANPICRQRIVSLIRLDPPVVLANGGSLDLRVDPRGMFNEVDFSSLQAQADGSYVIPDSSMGEGASLFSGVVANSGVYQLSFNR